MNGYREHDCSLADCDMHLRLPPLLNRKVRVPAECGINRSNIYNIRSVRPNFQYRIQLPNHLVIASSAGIAVPEHLVCLKRIIGTRCGLNHVIKFLLRFLIVIECRGDRSRIEGKRACRSESLREARTSDVDRIVPSDQSIAHTRKRQPGAGRQSMPFW
jgi:hypothetical protein